MFLETPFFEIPMKLHWNFLKTPFRHTSNFLEALLKLSLNIFEMKLHCNPPLNFLEILLKQIRLKKNSFMTKTEWRRHFLIIKIRTITVKGLLYASCFSFLTACHAWWFFIRQHLTTGNRLPSSVPVQSKFNQVWLNITVRAHPPTRESIIYSC